MPNVCSSSCAQTISTWVAFDVHKDSISAGILSAAGSQPEVVQFENGEQAIRRFIRRLGDPQAFAICYEAGPCGYGLYRLLTSAGIACDIIAPSLTPVRPGDRVKTDRRDAVKLVRLYRAGELSFVCPPTPAQEGLRDLVRCRDDLRCARTAARQRIGKQLLRYGCIYREGKTAWTRQHRAWLHRQRLNEPLAQAALQQMLCHLGALDAQLLAIDAQLNEIAHAQPWCDAVRSLSCFRGVSTLTALSLLAEIGDFHRFASARELMSFLGLTVSEYSSGARRTRGSITKTGNRHARRLLVEAAWHYQYPPRLSARIRAHEGFAQADVLTRAWQAQIRLHQRHRHLTANGKPATVATIAVARELCGFLWATMTDQPLRADRADHSRAGKQVCAA
jgi:transposase